jgi:isoleucyl-tRNA synthetase
MSKSAGNALSPQDVMKQNGADILRLWVAMVDYTDDVMWGPQLIARAAESYRDLRNRGRYLLSNLTDFDPAADAVPLDQLADPDRWIVHGASQAFARCRQAYEDYNFHIVVQTLSTLSNVDLSKAYVDFSKDTMYCEGPKSFARRSAQTAMYHVLAGFAAYLAPILSFTADEFYEAMPGAKEASVHLTEFPSLAPQLSDAEEMAWDRILELRDAVNAVIEPARKAKQIGQSLEADIKLYMNVPREDFLGKLDVDLAKLFIVSHIDIEPLDAFTGTRTEVRGLGEIGIALSPARGKKCGRCWQYREEVAVDGDLCARCEDVVSGMAVPEEPTV